MPRTAFESLSKRVTEWAGSTSAFVFGLFLVILWLATGPFFGWSTQHSFLINNYTTVVTFLMVFLIQRSHNKDTLALQLKLDEIITLLDGAGNRLINAEELSEDEIAELQRRRLSSASTAATRSPARR